MVFDQHNEKIINPGYKQTSTPGLALSGQEAHIVKSYRELLNKIAQLAFYNSRYKLLFRGQKRDYRTNQIVSKSNLFPSILRTSTGEFDKKRQSELGYKFSILEKAELLLCNHLKNNDLKNNQIINWAILQHYEICDTPLLDITSSLQTALSFAIGQEDEGYLFVLAFPHLNGPISVSIESNTVIVDLAQVMDPEILRPHFQNAMLVGDYPLISKLEYSHGMGGKIGNNFCCRLLTKFKLMNCKKWAEEGFVPTPKEILFPNDIDKYYESIKGLKLQLVN